LPGGVDDRLEVLAQPSAEPGLLIDVPGAPAGSGLHAPSSFVVGAVEDQVMNVPDPGAPGENVEMPGDERCQQQGRQPVPGDAVGDVQPGVAERRPVDLTVLGRAGERVDEPVHVEDGAPSGHAAEQLGEDRRLAGPGRAGDHEERADNDGGIDVVAGGAAGDSADLLHEHGLVTGVAVVHG
jgi:hypothetical protein